jgi:Domain of unknown function (DUF4145)
MKCPHCRVDYHDNIGTTDLGQDIENYWEIHSQLCPNCKKLIFSLVNYVFEETKGPTGMRFASKKNISNILIRPKAANRPPVPIEVPAQFSDYKEACLVLADSSKASAALSRRCLQNILRDKLGIKKKDLSQEIQEVLDKAMFPSDILESIDSIRNIGNFAAHPIKSQSSGEILEVEPHEADWNLDVLEMIFDFLFVRPATIKRKRDALNLKLADTGKPDMK